MVEVKKNYREICNCLTKENNPTGHMAWCKVLKLPHKKLNKRSK